MSSHLFNIAEILSLLTAIRQTSGFQIETSGFVSYLNPIHIFPLWKFYMSQLYERKLPPRMSVLIRWIS